MTMKCQGLCTHSVWVILGIVLAWVLPSAYADSGAIQLAQRVYDRPNGLDATSSAIMSLAEPGRSPRVRRLVTFRLDKQAGEIFTLIRFTAPGDIAGTGLLTQDYRDAETGQWIYLPALERVRRISASRKGGRFVNSEYYFEDLRDRKVSQDRHRILGRESINNVLCEMLESIPVDADNSVYVKRISWIDPASALPLRIDYYEKTDTHPSKRWIATKVKRIQGYWTILESVMTDLANGNSTTLTIEKIVYDRRLPARLFTPQALEDESIEEDFLP